MTTLNSFQTQASDLLGITADKTNLYLDRDTTNIYGDLTVSGTITSGGSTGSTGSGDLEVTGDLIVDQSTYLKSDCNITGAMGCTGNAVFYGQVRAQSYVRGVFQYYFVSVNNASAVYTSVSDGASIISNMIADSYEQSNNGLTYDGSGEFGSYFQPINAGIYQMELTAVLKLNDGGQKNAVVPYIYARDSSSASWVITTNTQSEESFGGFTINSNSNQPCVTFSHIVYIPSGNDKRVDLRAYVSGGTFNISWATFIFRYLSSI